MRQTRLLFGALMILGMTACSSESPGEPARADLDPHGGAIAPATEAPPANRLPVPASSDLYGVPAPSNAQLRELYDVSRDVAAVAAGEKSAAGELSDDLYRFAKPGLPRANVDLLVADLSQSIKAKTVMVDQAARITTLLYATMRSSQLTADQRQSLAKGLETALTAVGISSKEAGAVVQHVERIASDGKG